MPRMFAQTNGDELGEFSPAIGGSYAPNSVLFKRLAAICDRMGRRTTASHLRLQLRAFTRVQELFALVFICSSLFEAWPLALLYTRVKALELRKTYSIS
jgi:hypothetical protein